MKKGFTLIELLVVISVIGVLTTLVMANLNAARERGRDVARKSDLRNIQAALRLYYNDLKTYPASNSSGQILGCGNAGTSACAWGEQWAKSGTVYMNTLPADPLPGQSYKYLRTDSETYTLSACLENKSDEKGQATSDTGWCPSGWMYQVRP